MSIEVLSDDPDLGIYNIIANRGETLSRVFTWTDDSDNPINLTGATAQMKVRKFYPKTFLVAAYWDDPVIEAASGGNGISFSETEGIIYVTVSAEDMEVTPDIYNWDLEITMGSQVTKLLRGSFEVRWETSF